MLSRLLSRLIRRQEKTVGVSLRYLDDVAQHSPGLVLKIGLLGPLGNHRRALPAVARHVASVRATLAEDCGACVQIAVNLALADGVSRTVLSAVVNGRLWELPPNLEAVCKFIDALQNHETIPPATREQLEVEYGRDGVAELAATFALASFFPRFKRGLGEAQSCALRPVEV
jgi:alkylhydroperoxidase family enzyme